MDSVPEPSNEANITIKRVIPILVCHTNVLLPFSPSRGPSSEPGTSKEKTSTANRTSFKGTKRGEFSAPAYRDSLVKMCYPEIAMTTPRRSQEVRPARQPCVEGREKGESQGRALKKVLARMAHMCCAGKITDRHWEALGWALVLTLCIV